MADSARVTIDEVLAHFDKLEDPRSTVNRLHSLPTVIVISIMAILAGAGGPTAIGHWAKAKEGLLTQWLSLTNGVPRKDVFRRVLMALKPEAFQACFADWLTALRQSAAETTGVQRPTLAVDGKTLRRSHDRGSNLGALHSVSVWASEYGLSLAQVATEEKSNEITAIPKALALVNLQGAIVTIDAMGTQTAIAQQIVEGKGDYVLALKGNQETLYAAATEYLDQQSNTDFKKCRARRHVTREKGHGRKEIRTYIQLPVPENLSGSGRWAGLRTLGVAILHCIRDGKETAEARYFISSLKMGVRQFAQAVRSHWGIENSCHWCLDVTYREDESRIREAQLRENFAWINRHSLSLLKQHPGKQSVTMKRRICGWNDEFLIQVLTGECT